MQYLGEIQMTDDRGVTRTRTIAPAAKKADTTMIISVDGSIRAGKDGAIFLRVGILDNVSQGPYQTMDEVTTKNLFPNEPHVEPAVRKMDFPFLKVDTLDWANEGPNAGRKFLVFMVYWRIIDLCWEVWKDFEFYNLTGFHVFFNDNIMEEVVHIQAWTLGLGETVNPLLKFSVGLRFFTDLICP